MKKTLVALALLTAAGSAYSANVIRFFGEVTDRTCQILVNDNPTDPAVLLNPVTVTEMNAAGVGDLVNPENVNVKIYDCDATVTTAGIRLVPNSLDTVGSGATAVYYLQNILLTTANATAAKEVYFRLADANGNFLSFETGDARVTTTIPAATNEANLTFQVGYAKKAGTIETGLIQSNVQYAITYQ